MENKIVRMDIKVKKTKSGGGGTPNYVTPLNLDGHKEIIKFLSSVKNYTGLKTFFMANQKTESIHFKDQSLIPAPRKRFNEDMKFIFGENKLNYDSTIFSNDQKNLFFIYSLSFDEIEIAISRLKILDEFLDGNNVNEENINEFFINLIGEGKHIYTTQIASLAEKYEIRNFSYTKIVSYLSKQFSIFLSLTPGERSLVSDGEEKELVFCSNEYASIAMEKLKKLNLKISKNDRDKKTFVVNGVISKESNVTLDGFLYENKAWKKEDEIIGSSSKVQNPAMFSTFSKKTINTIVGVIDGGIQDGFIKENAYMYEDSVTLGYNDKLPLGTHAEEVSSLLMFANDLSIKTNDKLTNPRVAIFNVIHSDTNYIEFKGILEDIIEANHSKIKIWSMSVNFQVDVSDYEVSDYAVFLDGLQQKYGVLFIISTGNSAKEGELISPPADSFRAISVSSTKSDLSKTSYTKTSRIGVQSFKPDVSIFGGDVDDRITIVSGNIPFTNSGGTSYATPLVSRLVANLYELDFTLLEIPAILTTYSAWTARENDIKDKKYMPTGVLKVDNTPLFEMVKNKMMLISTVSIKKDYRQGMFDIKFPQHNGGYDLSLIASINVDATFAENSTYEYVLDSTKVRIGRQDPFNPEKIISADSRWIYNDDIPESFSILTEASQRMFKGKYKNRDIIVSLAERSRSSTKTKRATSESLDITSWGVTFVRDMIDGQKRGRASSQSVAIAVIAESQNKNFYDEFLTLNNNIIINNVVNVESEISANDVDDIKFI